MLNISNALLKVSVMAYKSCQFQLCHAENRFKGYILTSSRYMTTAYSAAIDPMFDQNKYKNHRKNKPKNDSEFIHKTSKIKTKDSNNFNGDPEEFGNLASPIRISTAAFDKQDFDEGDQRETKHLENTDDRTYKLSTKQYADMIKEHLNKKDLKGAIDILQEKMLKEDKVKPENYIYNLLIGACGRTGQAKQAFHLYNQMKKRSLKVTGGTYTALFNACATTAYPEDGLKRANHLREIMLEKGYQPNDTNYHAMIKAYGRCGDIATAFSLVDSMIDQNYVPTHETFNFLLQACVSDRDAGFRHALLVWRKMRDYNVKPTVYTYNLLLRSVRDCGLGDQEVATDVLKKIANCETILMLETKADIGSRSGVESNIDGSGSNSCLEKKLDCSIGTSNSQEKERKKRYESEESRIPAIQETDIEEKDTDKAGVSTKINTPYEGALTISTENWPNLLGITPHLGDIVSLSEVLTPQDRLLLLGGCSSFLSQMAQDQALPNIKTFTQMLDVIPGTIAAEKALMSTMKRQGVRCDIDWYNMLIKKRSMRFDYVNAQQVLTLVSKARLTPDVLTFGVLALGCKTKEEAVKLLVDMEQSGFSVNVEIVGAMLKQACLRWNFGYVLEMMETAKRHGITPNAQFYQHLHTFYTNARQMIYDKERGRQGSDFVDGDYFRKGFKLFSARYKNWLKEVQEKVPQSKVSSTGVESLSESKSDDKWTSRTQSHYSDQ